MKDDKLATGIGCLAVIAWLFGVLISLGFLGVVIWAIITLVHHFAG